MPGSGLNVKHETFEPSYDISPGVGLQPRAAAAAISVSCPGRRRKRAKAKDRLIPRRAGPRALWREWPIKLETDYIIKRKLSRRLEGAGASLDTVVKAQVYLSDREDVPAFNEVWLSHFKNAAGDHDHRDDQSRDSPSMICASRSTRFRLPSKARQA